MSYSEKKELYSHLADWGLEKVLLSGLNLLEEKKQIPGLDAFINDIRDMKEQYLEELHDFAERKCQELGKDNKHYKEVDAKLIAIRVEMVRREVEARVEQKGEGNSSMPGQQSSTNEVTEEDLIQ